MLGQGPEFRFPGLVRRGEVTQMARHPARNGFPEILSDIHRLRPPHLDHRCLESYNFLYNARELNGLLPFRGPGIGDSGDARMA